MACLYLSAVALSQSRLSSWVLPLKSLSRVAGIGIEQFADPGAHPGQVLSIEQLPGEVDVVASFHKTAPGDQYPEYT